MPFTPQERRVIAQCSTPEKVQQFLLSLPYVYEGKEERLRSFRSVVREQAADCIEGALAAAAIMSAHGHPPIVADLVAKHDWSHVLFIYRSNGSYGSVALSRDPNLYGRKPVFASVRELVRSYYHPYFADGGWLHSFAVANLDDSCIDWRFARRDIFEIEDFLNEQRHQRVKQSLEPAAVRKVLQTWYVATRTVKKKMQHSHKR